MNGVGYTSVLDSLLPMSSLDRLLNFELSWLRRSSTTATSSDGAVSAGWKTVSIASQKQKSAIGMWRSPDHRSLFTKEGRSVSTHTGCSLMVSLLTCADSDESEDMAAAVAQVVEE